MLLFLVKERVIDDRLTTLGFQYNQVKQETRRTSDTTTSMFSIMCISNQEKWQWLGIRQYYKNIIINLYSHINNMSWRCQFYCYKNLLNLIKKTICGFLEKDPMTHDDVLTHKLNTLTNKTLIRLLHISDFSLRKLVVR